MADLNEFRWIVNGFLEWHEGAPCPEGLIERARAAVPPETQSPPEGGEGLEIQKEPRERCPSKQQRDFATLRDALQQIADMDPKGIRADDLGRAARIASGALGVQGTAGCKAPSGQCEWPQLCAERGGHCAAGVPVVQGGQDDRS